MRRAILVGVSLLAASSTSSAASTENLYAFARPFSPAAGVSKMGFGTHTPIARHVAPGRYRLHISALSNLAFHLVGPGIDRRTPFTTADFAPIYRTWTIRLRRGRYKVSAEGVYADELRASGIRVRGAFEVP